MDLDELRTQIDAVDAQLLQLFLKRLAISEKIGAVKKENGLPVLDEKRQNKKLEELCNLTPAQDREAITFLFTQLMAVSRARQEGRM